MNTPLTAAAHSLHTEPSKNEQTSSSTCLYTDMANDSCPIRSQLSLVLMRSQVLIWPNVDPQSNGFPLRTQFSCYFKGQNQAGAGIGMNGNIEGRQWQFVQSSLPAFLQAVNQL